MTNSSAARLRRLLAAGGLTLAMTGTAFTGVAGAETGEDGSPPAAAANLLQCIAGQGVTTPGPDGMTTAWIDQVVAAARACGFELPEGLLAEARRRAAEAEAKRQCLANAGIAKPAEGQVPTPEQIAAFKAAMEACGIRPPAPRAGDDEPRAGSGAERRERDAPTPKKAKRTKKARNRAATRSSGRR